MTTQVLTLIPYTQYGVPSGNYDGSSSNWFGNPVKAVNYYRGLGHVETVWINVEGFQGLLTIQANLDRLPGQPEDVDWETSTNWINLDQFGDLSSQVTDYRPITLLGNYTWIRIRVEGFEAGVIKMINLTY
jgi:hypothetical protein